MINHTKSLRWMAIVAWLCPVFVQAYTPVQKLPGVVDAPKPTLESAPPASSAAPTPAPAAMAENETALYEQVRLLNQIPDEQLNDQTDPVLSLLRKMYDKDGPQFTHLKRLLGRAEIRGPLKAGAKGVLASLLSDRWDAFNLCGNLWLAALQTSNGDLRLRARQRLVSFIQPAHIPVLIHLLTLPGPNIAAYDVLQEVTGQTLDPSVSAWKTWWAQGHGKADLVGHLLETTDLFVRTNPVPAFQGGSFWYVPDEIKNSAQLYAKRSTKDQFLVSQWNQAALVEVKRYIERWNTVKTSLDRITHQPDARATAYLEKLVLDPGIGDYASAVLAWRGSASSLKAIQTAYAQIPSPGRALGRGSLGDVTVLVDLLKAIESNPAPSSIPMMDQSVNGNIESLRVTGQLPNEQVLEFLSRQNFGFETAATRSEKKKALKAARRWVDLHAATLVFDPARGSFAVPSAQ